MKRRVIPMYLVDFNVSSVNWHKLLFSMKVTITLCYRLKTSIKPWGSRRTATQREKEAKMEWGRLNLCEREKEESEEKRENQLQGAKHFTQQPTTDFYRKSRTKTLTCCQKANGKCYGTKQRVFEWQIVVNKLNPVSCENYPKLLCPLLKKSPGF